MEYIFYLTNSCNLKCKYCYEKNKINKVIDFNVIEKLLKERVNSKEKSTTISFFGGEPLLEKQLIYDTVTLGNNLTKKSKHQFIYSLTTNGTLIDDEFIKFCKKNNIAVGISIDGNADVHNINRINNANKESFDEVLKNSKKCLEANLNCMALPVICTNNVKHLADSIKLLINLGFKSITCNFNYSDDWNDNSLEILRQEYKKISDIYYNEFKKKNYIRIYPLDTKMYLNIHKKRCSDSCSGNRIAVNADGKFYPCIQFVGDSRFEIGDYKKGIDTERKKDILLRRLTSKVVCDECSLKDRCIYKCGCARIMTTNDIVEVSPIVCETERIYIEIADNLANKLYRDFKDEFILLNYRK